MPQIDDEADDEVEEYEEGRINFEKKLERELEQASNYRTDEEYKDFALTVQQIWNDSLIKDKITILETLEYFLKTRDEDRKGYEMFQYLENKDQFLKFVEAEPYNLDKFMFENKTYRRTWLEIYRVINNALKRSYYGRKRSWEKDDGFSSSKGDNNG